MALDLDQLRTIITRLVEVDPAAINHEARWESINVDRYDLFGILKDCERATGSRVPNEAALDIEDGTVGDLLAWYEKAQG